MKMAIISSTDYVSWPVGGMLYFLRDLLPYLSEYFEIELWGVSTGSYSHPAVTIRGKTFPFFSFGRVSLSRRKLIPNLIRVVLSIRKNKERILARGYEVLYFHGIPLELPFLMKKPEGTKILSHIHGLGKNPLSRHPLGKALGKAYREYRKRVLEKSDLAFISSDGGTYRKFLKNLPLKAMGKIHRLPGFVEPDLFHPMNKERVRQELGLDATKTIFISTLRLSPEKDPLFLIDVFKETIKKGIDANLIILGDGPLKTSLQRKIREEGLEDLVQIKGFVKRERLKFWLSSADIFLFSSKEEGFPLALIEAMACGLPIITPQIQGISDIVISGKTGYIVTYRKPELFASYIEKALGEYEHLRLNSLKRAQEFTPDKAAKKIWEAFQTL